MLKPFIGALALAATLAMSAQAQEAEPKAKEFAVMLTETDMKNFRALMSEALKSCGVDCATAVALLDAKVRKAVAGDAKAPKPAPEKPKP